MISCLDSFHPATRDWFEGSFDTPTRAQELAWPAIASGESTLVLAPTGSGKTLAAFLVAIDRLMFGVEGLPSAGPEPPAARSGAKRARNASPEAPSGVRVLYISPLKALAIDVERNLRVPLAGVSRIAEKRGDSFDRPAVAIRTGDTPARERAHFSKHPAEILITTPESLYLLLTSNAREALRSVQWVIVDEIHALVGTKRGAHLSLSLERLQEIAACPFQRIGLSATQRPLEEVARFLGGFEHATALRPRPIRIVDAGHSRQMDLRVAVPAGEMGRSQRPVGKPGESADPAAEPGSIWTAIHPMVLDLIRSHRSTLIFVNSRRLAERMAAALNDLAGELLVHAHHGSIAREQRLQIEEELKSGMLPAMVATSSLELGIDMGAIDLVIQVESPPSVTSAIQRIGRAGRRIDIPSKGVLVPKYRGDLLACAAIAERMMNGDVEAMRYPRNPLDILAQQIVAMVSLDDWTVDQLEGVVRCAAPFSELPRSLLEGTLDMLSGRYPSDDFAELRPRITWDRLSGTLRAREGARRMAVINGGTIPDRGHYGVFLAGADRGQGRVGELDEEMVYESRAGDTFLLGATSWRIEEITHDRVIVTPAPGKPGRMPFWHGESAGRPLEFGRAIGALARKVRELGPESACQMLTSSHALDEGAARSLVEYLRSQAAAAGTIPDDQTILVESYRDEMGDWRVCILCPFGARVLAPWAMAIGALVRERSGIDIDVLWTDDGIVARFPDTNDAPPLDLLIPDPDEVEDLVVRQLGFGGGGARKATHGAPVIALFASRFREAAARALLLPRQHAGQRSPLWQQRKRAADLLQATAGFGSFPIVLETFREILRDIFDMPAFVGLLREIRSRQVQIVSVSSRVPSPFAASLMFSYVGNFMYEGDAPLAERRAQALTVDPTHLRELLGEIDLRDLIDSDALEAFEIHLQHLSPERRIHHADGLHDLLIRLGDLSSREIEERSAPGCAGAWIDQLAGECRIVALSIAGSPRWIAAEDAGRYRDALGISPPAGLPESLLERVRDPLADLVSRYARTHGPFLETDLAARFGMGVAPILSALKIAVSAGRLVEGEFRPGGMGREWCDAGVLRALRQKSLARLRREVEPVEGPALARLYLSWQGIGASHRGRKTLLDVVQQLQGAAILASVLETQILPARLDSYDLRDLDTLTSSGSVLWVGREPLGQNDGRISLYLADQAAMLLGGELGHASRVIEESLVQGGAPNASMHERIRVHLAARGASFFPQIVVAVQGFPPEVLDALWDLVWAGEVTNDTIQPLRAYLHRGDRAASRETTSRAVTGRDGERRVGLRRYPTSGYAAAAGRQSISRSGSGMESSIRAVPAEASGRWSLVNSLVTEEVSSTSRIAAQAQQLLERYGVVTREAVAAEGIPGGFSSVYVVFKAMEDAGRVRRGYFVAGLGATQFADAGAVDHLRSLREPPETMETVLLSAVDPANPYGAALPWPEGQSRRPMRAAGSSVVLIDGSLAAWIAKGQRQIVTFPNTEAERDPGAAATEIARVLGDQLGPGKLRSIYVQEVDGMPPGETPLGAALAKAGFHAAAHGYLRACSKSLPPKIP